MLTLLASAPEPPIEVIGGESLLELSPWAVSGLLGIIIPLLTALITKAAASELLKGGVSMLLAAASGFLTTHMTEAGGSVFSQATLINGLIAAGTAITAYVIAWGAPDSSGNTVAGRLNKATPGIVGPSGSPPSSG